MSITSAAVRLLFFFLALIFSLPGYACGDCEYEACVLGRCACLPKSGCILQQLPAPVRPPDPGIYTEKLKHDPIGAIVNPLGSYNPTGIPQPGDIMEFAVKNPDQVISLVQNPGQVLYTPVIASIISGRNAVLANDPRPIPDDIKRFLLRWHSRELIDSVRWTSNWSLVQNTLQTAQMRFNGRTQAIALINTVVFRDARAANDAALWAHEMVHVQQYRDWGVPRFAQTWVNHSSDAGPVEAPAYARGEEAESILAGRGNSNVFHNANLPVAGQPQRLPSGTPLAGCGCWGFVDANASAMAPMCQSGIEGPQMCGPMGVCAGGGAPWMRVCR
ncbi:eCIS core domain-containing protein [Pseudoduganella buxea]|uniref:DUF4157 domain-containing protein n=1 Tax=Pseudoduganella buxea TaxID=1949069 RepID=A0A6I3SU23_9BURK|nr:DUF4157 domain-containing protein [Pseudoduganella buxea]MTV52648.1 DUF4157 domain-containing protein [Pseudoduganella buxea]